LIIYYGIDEITFSPVDAFLAASPHFQEIQRKGPRSVTVSWTGAAWLESAASLGGPWRAIPDGANLYTNIFAFLPDDFYRLKYFGPVEAGL
jgi:hypothetical protein